MDMDTDRDLICIPLQEEGPAATLLSLINLQEGFGAASQLSSVHSHLIWPYLNSAWQNNIEQGSWNQRLQHKLASFGIFSYSSNV